MLALVKYISRSNAMKVKASHTITTGASVIHDYVDFFFLVYDGIDNNLDRGFVGYIEYKMFNLWVM
jgi:hypothetical protein